MRSLTLACLFSATAVALPSQTTHLVGPGGFATFAAALTAAAPGDILLVQPGTYAEALDVDLGVTIRALGTVQIQQGASASWNVPAGQTLHVDGLTFQGSLDIRSGQATLSYCTVTPTFGGSNPALTAKDCSVHLVECAFTSLFASLFGTGWIGTLAENADVTAVGTTFVAAGYAFPATSVVVTNSRFVASSCSFHANVPSPGGTGLLANGGSTVWLSDSAILAGATSCPIRANGATVRHERCTLSTTSATNCAVAAPGPTLLGTATPTPLQNGSAYTLQLTGAPFQLIAVHASTGVATSVVPGLFEQPLQLDPASFWLAGLYVTDGLGAATATWTMPAGLFVDTPLWLEAITVEPTFPWQVGPAVGGIVR